MLGLVDTAHILLIQHDFGFSFWLNPLQLQRQIGRNNDDYSGYISFKNRSIISTFRPVSCIKTSLIFTKHFSTCSVSHCSFVLSPTALCPSLSTLHPPLSTLPRTSIRSLESIFNLVHHALILPLIRPPSLARPRPRSRLPTLCLCNRIIVQIPLPTRQGRMATRTGLVRFECPVRVGVRSVA